MGKDHGEIKKNYEKIYENMGKYEKIYEHK